MGGIEMNGMKTIYVMGNAPSMASVNWRKLDGETTIGVNYVLKAYEPTYLFMLDRNTWLKDPQLFENRHKTTIYAGEQHAIGHIPPKGFTIFKRYDEEAKKDFFSPDIKQGLRYGQSSIIPALNFAALQKPELIVLMGVDLNCNKHFYEHEPRGEKFPAVRDVLAQLAWCYDGCLRLGIQMLNASPAPDCRIEFMPKIKLDWYK